MRRFVYGSLTLVALAGFLAALYCGLYGLRWLLWALAKVMGP